MLMLSWEIVAESPTYILAETARWLWSGDQATKKGLPMKRGERKDVPIVRIMRLETRLKKKTAGKNMLLTVSSTKSLGQQ